MKKNAFLFIAFILIFVSVNLQGQKKNDTQRNKEAATKYHELNPANIDAILAVNFIGRNEKSRHTWNRENPRQYLTDGSYKVDSIFYQIAEIWEYGDSQQVVKAEK